MEGLDWFSVCVDAPLFYWRDLRLPWDFMILARWLSGTKCSDTRAKSPFYQQGGFSTSWSLLTPLQCLMKTQPTGVGAQSGKNAGSPALVISPFPQSVWQGLFMGISALSWETVLDWLPTPLTLPPRKDSGCGREGGAPKLILLGPCERFWGVGDNRTDLFLAMLSCRHWECLTPCTSQP